MEANMDTAMDGFDKNIEKGIRDGELSFAEGSDEGRAVMADTLAEASFAAEHGCETTIYAHRDNFPDATDLSGATLPTRVEGTVVAKTCLSGDSKYAAGYDLIFGKKDKND